jgi:hypothetical protein
MKGKYTPKTRFLSFIQLKSRKKESFTEAIIDGKYFSQDGLKFHIKIHDDGSIDLDEIATTFTTEHDRGRYLELLEDKTASLTKLGLIVNGVEFKRVDSDELLILVVQNDAPYSKVTEILESKTTEVKVSKKQKNKLAQIFELFGDLEKEEDNVKDTQDQKPIETPIVLKDNFEELKIQKKKELEQNLSKLELELEKLNFEKVRTSKALEQKNKEVELTKSRIRDLGIKPELNGYQVFVSERKGEKIDLDEENEKIIRNALSKVKSVNVDAFMDIFKSGEYHITLFKEGKSIKLKEIDDVKVVKTLIDLNLMIEGDNIVYRGDKDWHSLVQFFVESGFEQVSSTKLKK